MKPTENQEMEQKIKLLQQWLMSLHMEMQPMSDAEAGYFIKATLGGIAEQAVSMKIINHIHGLRTDGHLRITH